MLTLVIDSATDACSAALFDGGRLVEGRFELLGRGHAERLVPMIATLPDKGRAQRIAVALGPGSFTGIRVGLAAARALALAWGAQSVGYETPALIAAQALADTGAQGIGVCNEAGHGQWFVQRFTARGEPLAPVASLPPEQAVAFICDHHVAGSRAEALVAQRGQGEALALWPDARRFALLDPARLTNAVRPAYGRAPDAALPRRAS